MPRLMPLTWSLQKVRRLCVCVVRLNVHLCSWLGGRRCRSRTSAKTRQLALSGMAERTAETTRRRRAGQSRSTLSRSNFISSFSGEFEDAGCSSGLSRVQECVRVNTGKVSSRPTRGVFDEGKTCSWGSQANSQGNRSYP